MVDMPCKLQQRLVTEEYGDQYLCMMTCKDCPYWKFAEESECNHFVEDSV